MGTYVWPKWLILCVVCLKSEPCPGEKDRANTHLAWALVGTTRISADIHVREILTVQRPVTPKRKRASVSGSKINDDDVWSKLVAGDTQGLSTLLLKLSSQRFEHTQNRSTPSVFNRTKHKWFGAVPYGNTRKTWCKNHIFSTIEGFRKFIIPQR